MWASPDQVTQMAYFVNLITFMESSHGQCCRCPSVIDTSELNNIHAPDSELLLHSFSLFVGAKRVAAFSASRMDDALQHHTCPCGVVLLEGSQK